MTVYFDSSALVKRYVAEMGRDEVEVLLNQRGERFTSEITVVEVRRVLAQAGTPVERAAATLVFLEDVHAFNLVRVHEHVIEGAAALVETVPLRSMDALHVASAVAAGCDAFVSFDRRQRACAQGLGLRVLPEAAE